MQPRKAVRLFTGLVGLPPEPEPAPVNPTQKLPGVAASEEDVRREFGVEEKKRRPKLPESYREFFGLEPEDLIGFFDTQIGVRTDLVQVDFVVPPSMIQHRLRRLQKIINRANELIKSWDVGVMKIRRAKDDILDEPTRERYKREERARLARCYAKRAKYYAAAKGKLVEKPRRIQTPLYLRDVVDDSMVFTNVERKWVEHEDMWLDGKFCTDVIDSVEILSCGGQFDLTGYKRVMSLGSAALDELGETDGEMRQAWENLVRWENAVIAAAVRYRVIQPRYDLAVLLGLDKVIADLNDQVAMEDFEQRDMDPEDVLALKTGGRCYGGQVRIQSEGFWYRANGAPVPRAITSFDKPVRDTARDEVKYAVAR
jgi:hypothetical protein